VTTNGDEDSNAESIGDNQGGGDDNEDGSDRGDDRSGNNKSDTMYNPDTWIPSVQRVHGVCVRKGRYFSHLHVAVVYHAMP
jgi:hypothetical protein